MTNAAETLLTYSMATATDFVGLELGTSNWVVVDQARIDRFAASTGDQQWIHVDVERATRQGPFSSPIAHGYLSLSLTAAMLMEIGIIPPDAASGLNYGPRQGAFPHSRQGGKAGARPRSAGLGAAAGRRAATAPYRPFTLARLSTRLLDELGYGRVDVLGVSWAAYWRSNSPSSRPGAAGGRCSPPPRPAI